MSTAAAHAAALDAPPTALARWLGRIAFLCNQALGRTRHDRAVLERVHDMPLLVLQDVFNPLRMRTGAWFAGLLDARVIPGDAEVLDLGTGSGVCALFAARHAHHVLAVDINPAAVDCARANALLNRAAHRMEVLRSDLFDALGGRRFDRVLFNPPFLAGQPAGDYDRAWRSTDVAARFAAQLGAHLKPDGEALVLLSSYGGARAFLDALAHHGFMSAPFATRRYYNETVMVFRVRPALSGTGRNDAA
jgi:HemK-related putative methylase